METIFLAHYKSTKPLYIVGLTDDPDKCMVIFNEAREAVAYHASHKEADNRMMFSIHQQTRCYNKLGAMVGWKRCSVVR